MTCSSPCRLVPPSGSYQKIDAALNDGAAGPDNLIQTITNDLGIPINHYVELKFDGFQSTVNALGGINVDFPEPLFDVQSGLYIPTAGCVHLNGSQALALVRSRHLQYDPPGDHAKRANWPFDPESDLSRIVRDHTFLRVVAATAESTGLTSPLKANAFLGAIINQITIDPGLKGQLISLATHYRHLNPAAIPETTLPVTQVGGAFGYQYNRSNIGDVEFAVQPSDNQVITAWDANALPAPVAPSAVNVVNISTVAHAAANVAADLRPPGSTWSTPRRAPSRPSLQRPSSSTAPATWPKPWPSSITSPAPSCSSSSHPFRRGPSRSTSAPASPCRVSPPSRQRRRPRAPPRPRPRQPSPPLGARRPAHLPTSTNPGIRRPAPKGDWFSPGEAWRRKLAIRTIFRFSAFRAGHDG